VAGRQACRRRLAGRGDALRRAVVCELAARPSPRTTRRAARGPPNQRARRRLRAVRRRLATRPSSPAAQQPSSPAGVTRCGPAPRDEPPDDASGPAGAQQAVEAAACLRAAPLRCPRAVPTGGQTHAAPSQRAVAAGAAVSALAARAALAVPPGGLRPRRTHDCTQRPCLWLAAESPADCCAATLGRAMGPGRGADAHHGGRGGALSASCWCGLVRAGAGCGCWWVRVLVLAQWCWCWAVARNACCCAATGHSARRRRRRAAFPHSPHRGCLPGPPLLRARPDEVRSYLRPCLEPSEPCPSRRGFCAVLSPQRPQAMLVHSTRPGATIQAQDGTIASARSWLAAPTPCSPVLPFTTLSFIAPAPALPPFTEPAHDPASRTTTA
jgi:hypothetical protein